MKLWLDDLRPAPTGWTWVKTVEQAIALLKTGQVEEASLDHDLGEDQPEGRKLALWMAEHDCWPRVALAVHSGNPVGVEYMCGVIDRYGPYQRVVGQPRFTA